MPKIVICKLYFLPNLSPIYPNIMDPNGLDIYPIAKTANATTKEFKELLKGKKVSAICEVKNPYKV